MQKEDKTKVVFLDIDGVLNSHRFFEGNNIDVERVNRELDAARRNGLNTEILNPYTLLCFDPKAVMRLNRIIDQTGAILVLSTAWCRTYNIDEMRLLLAHVGVTGKVDSQTPRKMYSSRETEVSWWLEAFEVANGYEPAFVILEDSHDMGALRPKTLYTHATTGLQDVHVELAIERLGPIWAEPTLPRSVRPEDG